MKTKDLWMPLVPVLVVIICNKIGISLLTGISTNFGNDDYIKFSECYFYVFDNLFKLSGFLFCLLIISITTSKPRLVHYFSIYLTSTIFGAALFNTFRTLFIGVKCLSTEKVGVLEIIFPFSIPSPIKV